MKRKRLPKRALFIIKNSVVLLICCLAGQNIAAQTINPVYNIGTTDVDVNGWYLNPKWLSQVSNPPALPNPYTCWPGIDPFWCRNQYMWKDENSFKCPSTAFQYVWIPGHYNFAGATFEGRISWSDHSGNDDDYNFHLVPEGGAGLTYTNPDEINLEFDSDETIDHFHTTWWSNFHHAVDNSNADALAMVNNVRAIAFGIFGLDCAHDCASELHPVMALAMEVDPSDQSNEWAIFVRNWGNEGYCSSGTETLDPSITSYTFFIKHPGAIGVDFTSEFLCRGLGGSGPSVQLVPKEGALVTFGFPSADQRERINGTITLKWQNAPVENPQTLTKIFPNIPVTLKVRNPEIFEEWADHLITSMTPNQRKIYYQWLPKPKLYMDSQAPSRFNGIRYPKHLLSDTTVIKLVRDPERDQRDMLKYQALVKAYNGKLPVQQVLKKVTPKMVAEMPKEEIMNRKN